MVFFCGFVVSLCGVRLVLEVAEMAGFVVGCYCGGPFFDTFVPVDPFVPGGFSASCGEVSAVLCEGCESEV